MLGTVINAAAVVIGSSIGLIFHTKLPRKIMNPAFYAIGLFTLVLGMMMALKTSNLLIMIFSIVIGTVIGEYLDIDQWINRFGKWIKMKLKTSDDRFSEGFITAFLLYCMGSMTILGAFEEGLSNTSNLLIAKSVLDGFSSIILAATIGIGVLFSFIPLLLFQGGLTILAAQLQPVFSQSVINELSAVGGIILLGLGITILDIKELKVVNMLPSLFIAVILAFFLL